MKVKVFDGDLMGWVEGCLARQLQGANRWTIFTEQEYALDRYIKEEYKDMIPDGCGYVLVSSHCPKCGSYEIDDNNSEEMVCYDCDTYWNDITKEVLLK